MRCASEIEFLAMQAMGEAVIFRPKGNRKLPDLLPAFVVLYDPVRGVGELTSVDHGYRFQNVPHDSELVPGTFAFKREIMPPEPAKATGAEEAEVG